MAIKKYIGTGEVTSADFKKCTWIGQSKDGKAVKITLYDAINMSNIDLTFAEKNDVVPSIEMTACYDNENEAASSTVEPWDIEIDGSTVAGADEILLGAGKFYIEDTLVGLTRGGGSFNVEREYREINADGDRGPVKGRIVMESSRAKLTMNVLTFLTKFTNIYPGVAESV